MIDPDDYDGADDDAEILIECPYCDGDGFVSADGIMVECGECGGTGWE